MAKSNTASMLSRIEMRIAELGMSKEQFYSLSGISSASFSQWNTGAHEPSKKKIGQAAAALGVTFEYLWNGKKENKPALPQENELTEMQTKAVEMIKNMTDAQLKAFIAAAEAFLKD